MWRRVQGARSLYAALLGDVLAVFPALILLLIYGFCLTDPSRLVMFCCLDPGFWTWPLLAVILFGVGVAAVGAIWSFLQKPLGSGFVGDWREKAEAARGKFGDVAGLVKGKGRITPGSPADGGSLADTFSQSPT